MVGSFKWRLSSFRYRVFWQLQLRREAEERKQKEDEEKKEKLRLLKERKEMEKKASELCWKALI